MPSGYSKTPLEKKLGIKEGYKMLLYNSPNNYFKLLTDIPASLEILETIESESADFIHLFCTSIEELKKVVIEYKPALKKKSALWVSWPKGKSSIQTDLKREIIREQVLQTGLVDIKVAAIDEDWSGLKFVYRIKDR